MRCAPPKSQRVKAHTRGSGAKKRRRKAAARKAAATRRLKGTYYVCVQPATGRTCGVHHRSLRAAVKHRVGLDRAARAYAARYHKRGPRGGRRTTPAQLWTLEPRKG